MSISARKLLARNIKLHRTSLGWSQETLAELSRLHRSYIGAIERAEHNIGLDNVERIAITFGLSVKDLLDDNSLNQGLQDLDKGKRESTSRVIVHKQILIELLNQSKDLNYELALVYLAHSGLIIEGQ